MSRAMKCRSVLVLVVGLLALPAWAACPDPDGAGPLANTCIVHPNGGDSGAFGGTMGTCASGTVVYCCEAADCDGAVACTGEGDCQTMSNAQELMDNGDTISIWPGTYTGGGFTSAEAQSIGQLPTYNKAPWIFPNGSSCTGTCNFTYAAYSAAGVTGRPVFTNSSNALIAFSISDPTDTVSISGVDGWDLDLWLMAYDNPHTVTIDDVTVGLRRFTSNGTSATVGRRAGTCLGGADAGSSCNLDSNCDADNCNLAGRDSATWTITDLTLFSTDMTDVATNFIGPLSLATHKNPTRMLGVWYGTTVTFTGLTMSHPATISVFAGSDVTINNMVLIGGALFNHGIDIQTHQNIRADVDGDNWLVVMNNNVAHGECVATVCVGSPMDGETCSTDADCRGCGVETGRRCGNGRQSTVIDTWPGEDPADRSFFSPTGAGNTWATYDCTGGGCDSFDSCAAGSNICEAFRNNRLIDVYECGTSSDPCTFRNITSVGYGLMTDFFHTEGGGLPPGKCAKDGTPAWKCKSYIEIYNSLMHSTGYAADGVGTAINEFYRIKSGSAFDTDKYYFDGNHLVSETVGGVGDDKDDIYDPLVTGTGYRLGFFCGSNESSNAANRDSALSFVDWQNNIADGGALTLDQCSVSATGRDPHSSFTADNHYPLSDVTFNDSLFADYWSNVDWRASRQSVIDQFRITGTATALIDKGVSGVCSSGSSGCTGSGCIDGDVPCGDSGTWPQSAASGTGTDEEICPRCMPGVSTCTGGTCNAVNAYLTGSGGYCPATDIEGNARSDNGCDIGAYEAPAATAGGPLWYIDDDATGGTGCGGGPSVAEACSSFTELFAEATLEPGDTVYVRAGTYNERVLHATSGTLGNPITFTQYAGDKALAVPTVDGDRGGGAEVTVPDGFGLVDFEDEDYIVWEYIDVKNSTESGIRGNDARYITIQNVTVDNNGDASGEWGIHFHENAGAGHIVIRDSTVSGSYEHGIVIRDNAGPWLVENCTVDGNNVAAGNWDGILAVDSDDGWVRNSTCINHGATGDCYDVGEEVDGTINRIVVEYNDADCTGTGDGYQANGEPNDIIMRFNTGYKCSAVFYEKPHDVFFYHNTLDRIQFWAEPDNANSWENIDVRNNIFMSEDGELVVQHAFGAVLQDPTGLVLEGNIYRMSDSGGGSAIDWVDASALQSYAASVAGWDSWVAAEGREADGNGIATVAAVSTFVTNSAAYDYTPVGDGLAVDAGKFIAKTTDSGTGTVITVDRPRAFSAGGTINDVTIAGDSILIDTDAVTVTAVSSTQLTVTPSITWSIGDEITFAYNGTAPDMGAVESSAASAETLTGAQVSGVSY